MPPDRGAPRSLSAFREATMALDNVYSIFPKACGLSEAEYWSLLFIYEGAETQSQISGQLYLSRQTLNSAFKLLREKGFVRLEPCKGSRRSKRAVLTETGRDFVESNVLRMHRVEARAWQQMDGDEQEALTTLLRKFSDLIRRELDGANGKSQQQSSEDSRPQPEV